VLEFEKKLDLWARLPPDLAAPLPFDRHPQLRVEGELADDVKPLGWLLKEGRR